MKCASRGGDVSGNAIRPLLIKGYGIMVSSDWDLPTLELRRGYVFVNHCWRGCASIEMPERLMLTFPNLPSRAARAAIAAPRNSAASGRWSVTAVVS
jgi:hypothetical protein